MLKELITLCLHVDGVDDKLLSVNVFLVQDLHVFNESILDTFYTVFTKQPCFQVC